MTDLIRRKAGSAAACGAAALALAGCGGGGEPSYRLEPIAQLQDPTWVGEPPGEPGLLVIAERSGAMRAVRDGELLARPFLDLRALTGVRDRRSQGLLSVAFAPDYERSGRFYLAYTDRRGALRVEEFRRRERDAASADPATRRPLLRIPSRFVHNNGGDLLFGPRDRLYIAVGDGGYRAGGEGTRFEDPFRHAQDKVSLRGKLLRIDPRPGRSRPFRVPADNPFVGRPGNDLVFAYGLRDPRRFAYDPETQTWQIGDVGSRTYEELDIVARKRLRGANFGWSALEGPLPYLSRVRELRGAPAMRPARAYEHDPGCAVVAGFVVGDESLSALENEYVYGDYCSGEIRSFDLTEKARLRIDEPIGFTVKRLVSFGEDGAGRLYLAVDGSRGRPAGVYRLVEE